MKNINNATLSDLQQVNGIGPHLSEAILKHINKREGIRKLEDLNELNGIGQQKLRAIAERFVVIAHSCPAEDAFDPGVIYEPYRPYKDSPWDWSKIKTYYRNKLDEPTAIRLLYGGLPLSDLIEKIELVIEHKLKRIIKLKLYRKDGSLSTISNLSFKQLLVESSYRYGNCASRKIKDWKKDGWGNKNFNHQHRVEVAQNELSRWSINLFDLDKNFMPPSLKLKHFEDIKSFTIINNCTTNRGFELKLTTKEGKNYHGSVLMPQEVYQQLNQIQSGSIVRQGWWSECKINGLYPSLIDPTKKPDDENPTFGSLYGSDTANELICLDLEYYRDLATEEQPTEYTIKIEKGKIDYERWGGKKSEYHQKPKERGLFMKTDQGVKKTSKPPVYYKELVDGKVYCLPTFGEDGLYNVLKPVEMSNYQQLAQFTKAELRKTTLDLWEIHLLSQASNLKTTQLHRIVIGNINWSDLGSGYFTVDRFCFNPRKTNDVYQADWQPAAELYGKEKKALYAFLLGGQINQAKEQYVFIQAEGWGLERAILRIVDEWLYINLISYERILPIWRGKMRLQAMM